VLSSGLGRLHLEDLRVGHACGVLLGSQLLPLDIGQVLHLYPLLRATKVDGAAYSGLLVHHGDSLLTRNPHLWLHLWVLLGEAALLGHDTTRHRLAWLPALRGDDNDRCWLHVWCHWLTRNGLKAKVEVDLDPVELGL